MNSVPSRIVAYAKSQPEGALFGAHELLGFGARAAVDQALVRLVNAGDIMRVARGTYTLPVATRFGLRGPDELLLARSFARREGVTIARHGADEAHRLGLSTQVPVKTVWLTSGRAALLSVGSQTVAFKPAAQWLLADPGGRAGHSFGPLPGSEQTRPSNSFEHSVHRSLRQNARHSSMPAGRCQAGWPRPSPIRCRMAESYLRLSRPNRSSSVLRDVCPPANHLDTVGRCCHIMLIWLHLPPLCSTCFPTPLPTVMR